MFPEHLHRYVAVFEKHGDALIDEVALSTEEFEAIRSLLGYDQSDPMLYCYPLEGNVLGEVFALLGGRLRTGDYEYFLEAESP
jgi:hypothetical protein